MNLSAAFHRLFTALGAALALTSASPPLFALANSAGSPVDGIRCEAMEATVFHIHAHLSLFDHGRRMQIPSDVGRPLVAGCFYWLHTHTPDGIIHVESPVARTFTLGNFFDVWGEPLSARRVAAVAVGGAPLRVWVDGHPYRRSPRTIPLAQHTDIAIAVGGTAGAPPAFTGWGEL